MQFWCGRRVGLALTVGVAYLKVREVLSGVQEFQSSAPDGDFILWEEYLVLDGFFARKAAREHPFEEGNRHEEVLRYGDGCLGFSDHQEHSIRGARRRNRNPLRGDLNLKHFSVLVWVQLNRRWRWE